ncbi:hypothetical protein B0H14DRAFT_3720445 [Mycena olivaceomarginata]|nr:hypothetical protein B0H14DRAFT_3720445 [Mycena olivaceomarginata]
MRAAHVRVIAGPAGPVAAVSGTAGASASAVHSAAAPAAVGRRATAEAASYSAATPPRSTATAGPSIGADVPSFAVAGAAARQADATPAPAGAAGIYSNPNSPARGPAAGQAGSERPLIIVASSFRHTAQNSSTPTRSRPNAIALYTPSPPLRWRFPVPSTQVPSDDLERIAGYRLSALTPSRCKSLSSTSGAQTSLGPTRPWASKPTAHGTTATFPSLTNYRCGRKKVGRRVDPRSLHGIYMRRPSLFSAYWRAALLLSASVGAYAVRHGVAFRVPRSAAQRTGSPRCALLSSPPLLSTHSLAPSLPAIPVHPSPLERDARAPRLSTSYISSSVPSSLGPRAPRLPEPPSFPFPPPTYPFDPTDSYAYFCATYRTYSASTTNTIPSL